MLRTEIEEVAGVRTRLVRDLLRVMVERGEVYAVVQPGSARAKRYFRGAYTQVRGGGIPASAEREQARSGKAEDPSLLGCSPLQSLRGTTERMTCFPLL